MLKRILEWGNKETSFGDFIGLAVVAPLVRMARDIALIEPNQVDWDGGLFIIWRR